MPVPRDCVRVAEHRVSLLPAPWMSRTHPRAARRSGWFVREVRSRGRPAPAGIPSPMTIMDGVGMQGEAWQVWGGSCCRRSPVGTISKLGIVPVLYRTFLDAPNLFMERYSQVSDRVTDPVSGRYSPECAEFHTSAVVAVVDSSSVELGASWAVPVRNRGLGHRVGERHRKQIVLLDGPWRAVVHPCSRQPTPSR